MCCSAVAVRHLFKNDNSETGLYSTCENGSVSVGRSWEGKKCRAHRRGWQGEEGAAQRPWPAACESEQDTTRSRAEAAEDEDDVLNQSNELVRNCTDCRGWYSFSWRRAIPSLRSNFIAPYSGKRCSGEILIDQILITWFYTVGLSWTLGNRVNWSGFKQSDRTTIHWDQGFIIETRPNLNMGGPGGMKVQDWGWRIRGVHIESVWGANHVWAWKWDLAKEEIVGGLWTAVRL